MVWQTQLVNLGSKPVSLSPLPKHAYTYSLYLWITGELTSSPTPLYFFPYYKTTGLQNKPTMWSIIGVAEGWGTQIFLQILFRPWSYKSTTAHILGAAQDKRVFKRNPQFLFITLDWKLQLQLLLWSSVEFLQTKMPGRQINWGSIFWTD